MFYIASSDTGDAKYWMDKNGIAPDRYRVVYTPQELYNLKGEVVLVDPLVSFHRKNSPLSYAMDIAICNARRS